MSSHPALTLFELRGFNSPEALIFNDGGVMANCPACKHFIETESFEKSRAWIGGQGRIWPDVCFSINKLVLHQRVIDVLRAEKLKGYKAHQITITQINSAQLRSLPTTNYYLVEITGRVDINLNELDDEGGSICPACFTRDARQENPYRWKEKRIVPKLETWNGSDFVKLSNWRCGMKYCSKRFIDLASKHQWTNFIFGESLPGICLWKKPPKAGLSYWDPDWFAKLSERVKAKHADLFQ